MKYRISWDIVDVNEWCVHIYEVKENGQKTLIKELNKHSSSTGRFDLDNTLLTSGE